MSRAIGAARTRFGPFLLDARSAQLRRGDTPVPLKPKTYDLLAHFVSNPGELLTKDALFDAVWQGTTVGEEALTQAVKDLRKALGDDARAPTYIETVPKRGYRFIAPVDAAGSARRDRSLPPVLRGTLGGAAAGLIGGLCYGLSAGIGKDAVLIIVSVMTLVTIATASLGGLGITAGMWIASRLADRSFAISTIGAGLGGFVVGNSFHLVASGSFSVLLGAEYRDFAGGLEGLILGGGIAMGASLAGGLKARWPLAPLGGAFGGGAAGLLIALGDGKLMAASLAALARRSHGPDSDIGPLGDWAEASNAAPLIAAGEGALLGLFLIGALAWTRAGTRQITN